MPAYIMVPMRKNLDLDSIHPRLEKAVGEPVTGFLPSLLGIYGFAPATVKRLQPKDGWYSVPKNLLYKLVPEGETGKAYLEAIGKVQSKKRSPERFVVVTDGKRLMARDMRYVTALDIPFTELPEHYEFFFPWIGREAVEATEDNPADVKAAVEMAKLFDEIRKDNPSFPERDMNVFLTRLLFCFFADDSGIFKRDQFMEYLLNWTEEDGSDLPVRLSRLFRALDTREDLRADASAPENRFPYVNGSLFADTFRIPVFTRQSRKKLLECGRSDWEGINPDIFGSMFQAVISPEQRKSLGQHYTSVPNIMKVLRPLFLDGLRDELDGIAGMENGKQKDRKAGAFIDRISRIRVFDPACGSGNFLIIAYKELCRLEIEATKLRSELPLGLNIRLDNFYGIEIDDFPCEIARLSLWLAQHQMNTEYLREFGTANPTLPLAASGHIVNGNALELDWENVCRPYGEIYICGNPPYSGQGHLDASQKADKERIVGHIKNPGYLDYITPWFYLAGDYIARNESVRSAFVTTNSVFQGMQVSLWPEIFSKGVELFFAYESFQWKNNARDNAGVTVTVAGLRKKGSDEPCYIYSESDKRRCRCISPYLTPDVDTMTVVTQASKPLSTGIPELLRGIQFTDGGNLILSTAERDKLLEEHPEAKAIVRKLLGAEEYINGKERWCLWIDDDQLEAAKGIPEVNRRLEACRADRLAGKEGSDKLKLVGRYWQSREHPDIDSTKIIIPSVSSERREYIPIGFLNPDTVVSNLAFVIYDAPLWLFSILTSRMHMVWVRTVAGRLETRYRYSNTLCYNTFPFPALTESQKSQLTDTAKGIIRLRMVGYRDKTLAELYDPERMPDDLRAAHRANDLLVDTLYRRTGFESDDDRLQELFHRYKEMACRR